MKRLSRRTVLRGAGLGGLSVGLPTLEAMIDGHGRWHGPARAAAPVRVVLFTFPNGVPGIQRWRPAATGAAWVPTPCLEPLGGLRADLTIVSGLRHTAYYRGKAPGDHARGHASLWSGVPTNDAGGTGISLDQALARELGRATRLSSVQILADAYPSNDKLPHVWYASWTGANQPAPPISDPGKLFETLFGGGAGGVPPATAPGAAPDAAVARRRSVLDYVRRDLADLSAVLGARDRERLDGHLTAVRELEKQVGAIAAEAGATRSAAACSPGQRPTARGETDAKIRVMARLGAMALQCDVTRVMTFQYGYAVSNQPYPWLQINRSDHANSHSDGNLHLISTRYKMEVLGELLKLLKAAPEGGNSLLDSTVLLCASEVGTGQHDCSEMPVLLAGHAGGALPGGVHVRYPAGTPLNRMLVTVASLAGSSITRFGMDGEDALEGLRR